MAVMTSGIRARVRAQMTDEIKTIARRHLASDGANLSLRAVARDLGVVSSAIYRYFGSRDELLTALIVDAYNSLGAVVEAADRAAVDSAAGDVGAVGAAAGDVGAVGAAAGDVGAVDAAAGGRGLVDETAAGAVGAVDAAAGDVLGARWLAVCHAVRDWALAAPHEYALVYGSPVPGYQAPEDTIPAATRSARVLGGILQDGAVVGWFGAATDQTLTGTAAETIDGIRAELCPDAPLAVMSRAMGAWVQLFGTVSFELFGQFENIVDDKRAFFEHQMRAQATYIGF
jgi:AcrR family transcriptional regulator